MNTMESHDSILVILPHPDDESFPMGGTLAKYADKGAEITLICATKGELGIPNMNYEQAAAIREKELKTAASILGIRSVRFLQYLDGKLSDADPELVIRQLIAAMRQTHSKAVITFGPDGISGHPDHVAISRLVTTAFDRANASAYISTATRLYYLAPSEATFQGCGVSPSQEVAGGPVAGIDITDFRLQKVRAMQAHASQNPPYTGDPAEEANRLTCHEYFTLARPVIETGEMNDLFTY